LLVQKNGLGEAGLVQRQCRGGEVKRNFLTLPAEGGFHLDHRAGGDRWGGGGTGWG